MNLYAKAGERVYGTRTNRNGQLEDYHHCTVRHDIFIGELPDFPACLGDWQQYRPPVQRHFIRELENEYAVTTGTHISTASDGNVEIDVKTSTATTTKTNTTFVDLDQHGGGKAPEFGVPWNGESWWRDYEHDHGGDRASVHYDLRFRAPNGTCTWRMDELKGSK